MCRLEEPLSRGISFDKVSRKQEFYAQEKDRILGANVNSENVLNVAWGKILKENLRYIYVVC